MYKIKTSKLTYKHLNSKIFLGGDNPGPLLKGGGKRKRGIPDSHDATSPSLLLSSLPSPSPFNRGPTRRMDAPCIYSCKDTKVKLRSPKAPSMRQFARETDIATNNTNAIHARDMRLRCTGWPKKLAHFVLYPLTLSNIDRFSNSFHCQNQEKICNNNFT